MYRQSLLLKEKALGDEHPDTLASLFHLASLLKQNGKINEAKTLFQVRRDRRRRYFKTILGNMSLVSGGDRRNTCRLRKGTR